jgi:hypothetical protein
MAEVGACIADPFANGEGAEWKRYVHHPQRAQAAGVSDPLAGSLGKPRDVVNPNAHDLKSAMGSKAERLSASKSSPLRTPDSRRSASHGELVPWSWELVRLPNLEELPMQTVNDNRSGYRDEDPRPEMKAVADRVGFREDVKVG